MIKAPILDESALFLWSRIRDSNPPPTAWEAVALPDELTLRLLIYCSKGHGFCQPLFGSILVGTRNFSAGSVENQILLYSNSTF
jgi:hypothetical protein